MFALVDGNNFFVSCERVFKPFLNGKPVVVLSNNDGCVIARSEEVKKLGVKMGVPVYQIKDLIDKHHIYVYSSNYTLIGDMSNRMMNTLQSFVPEIEIYSVDEAFLNLEGMVLSNYQDFGSKVTKTVTKNTGIPVCMGVAPTKTLAKLANRFAKKYKGYNNVCVIDNDEKRIKALQKTEVGDIWGIGRRLSKRLNEQGVITAYDFTQLSRSFVRKNYTVAGERTWLELHGTSCIDIESIQPEKKSICTSRSFGHMQDKYEPISEAVANFASICAQKLRKQKSCAVSLMVFLHTNNFREDLPQSNPNCVIKLPVATNSSIEIVHYALEALKRIFADGYKYKKAGVIIMDIVNEEGIQTNLFDKVNREKHKALMKVLDKINSGSFRDLISVASLGSNTSWRHKQDSLSPCYSTRLSDIIKINCKL